MHPSAISPSSCCIPSNTSCSSSRNTTSRTPLILRMLRPAICGGKVGHGPLRRVVEAVEVSAASLGSLMHTLQWPPYDQCVHHREPERRTTVQRYCLRHAVTVSSWRAEQAWTRRRAEMARDLSPEVERLLQGSNSFVRKKAALCATR